MSRLTGWSHRSLLLVGLAVYILTAITSHGYYQADEHFQILEFADYKLGVTPAGDLPWEFNQQIRPALQPALTIGVIEAARALGLTSPFVQAFLLRLISAVLAIGVYAKLSRRLEGDAAANRLLAFAVLLWFVPYLSVRFSSENWSSLTFLAALLLLPISDDDDVPLSGLAAGGGLLALAFVFRFQMLFAIVGVFAWLVFQRRIGRQLVVVIFGALAVVAIGVAVDRWFYGNMVFTQWRYFQSNVLQGRAADFGVSPWWFYLPAFVMAAVPPISILLLGLAGLGAWRRRRHLLTWAFVPFVAAHMLVGHKELRFLFPMLFPFLWLVASGWDEARQWIAVRAGARRAVQACIAINVAALAFVTLRPSHQAVSVWQFLYDYCRERPATIYAEQSGPYQIGNLTMHFYRTPRLEVNVVPGFAAWHDRADLPLHDGDLLLQRHLAPKPVVAGFSVERIYRAFPDWLLQFDVTHWMERTEIWTVYRLSSNASDASTTSSPDIIGR